jgi:DNA-binding SARP family transcriptional activator
MISAPATSLLDRAVRAARPVLHLFGDPTVTLERRRVDVPQGSRRLLAFVALRRRRVERRYAAGILWPAGDDARAAGNLRSALWRLNVAGIPLLVADKCTLSLRDDVVVDVHVAGDWASRLVGGGAATDDLTLVPWATEALDLLPGWYEDWAVVERERIRQRMLHALEALSRALVAAGRGAHAVEAAMTAVAAEPLRESAQRVLLEAHLAEGNWVEGRRGYELYRQLLWRELGAEPDPALATVIGQARRRAYRTADPTGAAVG